MFIHMTPKRITSSRNPISLWDDNDTNWLVALAFCKVPYQKQWDPLFGATMVFKFTNPIKYHKPSLSGQRTEYMILFFINETHVWLTGTEQRWTNS